MASYLSRLYQFIVNHYDLEELRTLCFRLDIPFDDLHGEGFSGKVRELMLRMGRRRQIDRLLAALSQERREPFVQASLSVDPATLDVLYANMPQVNNGAAKSDTLSQTITIKDSSTINRVTQVAGDYHEHYHHPDDVSPAAASLFLPPQAYHRLVGRRDELNQVMSSLRDPQRKPMIAVVGLGGIGKTALARESVNRCQGENLFNNIVWTSAKTERFVGEGTVKTGVSHYDFDQLLHDIGLQCKRKDITEMPPNQKKIAVKDLLATRRVLVIVDNLETVLEGNKLVDDAFQILGQSKLLVTSRHRIKHEQMFTINLDSFPKDEGVTFLREVGKERGIEVVAQANYDTLIEIHRVTGGAPLAMKLVIGQMSRLPMDEVLKTLKETSFEGQDYEFYRFVFKHSWDMLELDAKKVLVSMSAFAPAIGGAKDAVRTVSEVQEPAFSRALDQLVLVSLVDSLGDLELRRYAIHQLTNYFILSDIVKAFG